MRNGPNYRHCENIPWISYISKTVFYNNIKILPNLRYLATVANRFGYLVISNSRALMQSFLAAP